MAYNEARNISKLLNALLQQELQQVAVSEIIVVASGCIDGTVEIVKDLSKKNNKIRLLVQEKGKVKLKR